MNAKSIILTTLGLLILTLSVQSQQKDKHRVIALTTSKTTPTPVDGAVSFVQQPF
jgi:hypothetical protein